MGIFKGIAKIAGGALGFAVGGPTGAKIGAALGGGIAGAVASKKGSKAQVASSNDAIAAYNAQLAQARADYQPYMQAGTNALANLQNPNAFTASPDYGFRRSEGMRGIEQSAAARGGAFSGNALKALNEYNSNLASGEYGNWFNRQASIAGMGSGAIGNIAQLGANVAGNTGNALMAGGDARASGIVGASNALQQGVSSAFDVYDYFKNGKKPNAMADNYGYGKNSLGRVV